MYLKYKLRSFRVLRVLYHEEFFYYEPFIYNKWSRFCHIINLLTNLQK